MRTKRKRKNKKRRRSRSSKYAIRGYAAKRKEGWKLRLRIYWWCQEFVHCDTTSNDLNMVLLEGDILASQDVYGKQMFNNQSRGRFLGLFNSFEVKYEPVRRLAQDPL